MPDFARFALFVFAAASMAYAADECPQGYYYNGTKCAAVNTSRSNVKNNIQVLPGPDGKVRCTSSASGKSAPCADGEIARLNKALSGHIVFTKGGAPAGNVASITQAKDGSLSCTTSTGTGPCTAAHVTALNNAAAAMPAAGDGIGGVGVGLGNNKNKPKE